MSITNHHIYAALCHLRDGAYQRDTDPAYAHLVQHKRVAIVGPATTTLGTRQGALLDSYDLVVRFNDTIDHLPITGSLADDIGTRTDILYCNQTILREHILEQKGLSHAQFRQVCDEVGVKYVVCTNNGLSFASTGAPQPACDVQDKTVITDVQRLLSQHGMRTRLRLVYAASALLIEWLGGYVGRTGLVAMVDLLSFDIAHLYITGMTMYHGGGHLFPQGSAELHPLKNRDGTWASSASTLGHNSYLELALLRLLAECFHAKLALDDHLRLLVDGGSQV
jgi:hypothetical protein